MPDDIFLKLQKHLPNILQTILGIFLSIGLVGCKSTSMQPTGSVSPSLIYSITPTQQVINTNSPNQTITVSATITPAFQVTPSPESNPPLKISPQNAASLVLLKRLGRGMLNAASFYSADGKVLVVPTTLGVDLYDATTLHEITFLPSLSAEGVTPMPAYPRLVTLSPDNGLLAASLYMIIFSPNGKVDETSIGEKAIFVWKMADRSFVQKITLGKEDSISDLAFSPDQKILAAGFESGKVRLWNTADWKELNSLKGTRLAFSLDGSLLATMPSVYGGDGKVFVFSMKTGDLLQQFEGQSALFSSKGLLAVENQGAVRVMDIEKGVALQAFNGESAAFSSDGENLALLDRGSIKLYRIKDGSFLQTMAGNFASVTNLEFAPDGKTIAAVGETPMCPNCLTLPAVSLWQISDGKQIPLKISDPIWLTYSPLEGYLVIGSIDAIHFLNPSNASPVAVFSEYATSVDGIAFSPDSRFLAADSGQPNLKVRFWQIEDSKKIKVLEDPSNPGYGTSKVAFSPDGKILFSQGRFWNPENGRRLTDLEKVFAKESPPYVPASVAFSPDKKTMAIGYLEGHLQLWNLGEKKLTLKLEGYGGEVVSLAFSTDGKTLAAVFAYPDYTIQLWQVPSGDRLLSIQGKEWTYEFTQAILSPDGETLATLAKNEDGTDMGIVELWRVSDGQRLLQLEAAGIMDAAFSPDGKIIATGSYDHTVRLWQTEDGKLLTILRGHGDYLTDLAFSTAGDFLASSSYDGTVIIWGLAQEP